MYLEHFKFKRLPFQREIPIKDLFYSHQLKEGLARFLYVCNKRSLGVLCGGVGAGKSTLIRMLEDELDPKDYRFIYIADSKLTPKDFYTYALRGLALEPPFRLNKAKHAFKKTVLDFYEHKNITCVFAIDEAQAMENSMLNEISFILNFKMDSFSPIAVILIGQSEIKTMLKGLPYQPILRRIEAFYSLEGMNENETKDYIEHQIKMAGANRPVFPNDVINKIYDYSKGVASSINNLCNNSLLDAAAKKQDIVDMENLNRAVAEMF